jgi:threonine dehydrogenase-like Zn-dependent dehydrogenase
MALTRAGGAIGIPGLYVTDDPGAKESNAQKGVLGLRIGLGWAKSHSFGTGQCPVLRYNRQLMMAILHDKVNVAKAVNVTVLPLAGCGKSRFGKKVRKTNRTQLPQERGVNPFAETIWDWHTCRCWFGEPSIETTLE